MKKQSILITLFLLIFSLLSGCSSIGDKTMSISVIYGAMSFLAFFLLIGYRFSIKKREPWFYPLLISVLIVNIGYFLLSISDSLNMALISNRISYFGSVFLPLSMLMIILKSTNLRYKKWLPPVLITVAVIVFLITASPGYFDIYYKSVSLDKSSGISVLIKEYGPLHGIYLFYLLIYFSAMVAAIIFATLKKKVRSNAHSIILAITVFVNIGVWLIEQLSKIDFEFLSVSYIISEFFLLGLHLMLQSESTIVSPSISDSHKDNTPEPTVSQAEFFFANLSTLTNTERKIYDLYLIGATTKDIMEKLNIKENTLKFHNKNLYGKLGVSSRRELISIATSKTESAEI